MGREDSRQKQTPTTFRVWRRGTDPIQQENEGLSATRSPARAEVWALQGGVCSRPGDSVASELHHPRKYNELRGEKGEWGRWEEKPEWVAEAPPLPRMSLA